MSLTKFLEKKDVRKRFREFFPKPRFTVKKEIIAPPLTENYTKVGTAFDYLLRFYIKSLNPQAICNKWISEISINLLKEIIKANELLEKNQSIKNLRMVNVELVVEKLFKLLKSIEKHHNIKKHKEKIKFIKKCYYQVEKIVSEAKKIYFTFISDGQITQKLIESTLLLAQVDLIYRPVRISRNLGGFNKNDVKDLKSLISLVNHDTFKANKICILNPTFGKASALVGGADADLVIDDALIDIKTTKLFQMKREYYNQLIGYYILYRISGIDGMPTNHQIKRLGIYFSRFKYLHLYNIKDILDETNFPEFIEWFKERAAQNLKNGKKNYFI